MQIHYVDVFTTVAGLGNPAAVVVDSGLSDAEAADVARQTGLETTFMDGTRLRYFQPNGAPMRLCGHGTLAALSARGRQGRFAVTTPAGELHVEVMPFLYGMAMPPVTLGEPVADPGPALAALGLAPADLAGDVVVGDAGRPKLLVPLHSTQALDALAPTQAELDAACAHYGVTGLYPFTRAARHAGAAVEARQFPSGGGMHEDPVTGVAAVCLAWYLWQRGEAQGCGAVKIEQGHAMGRPGTVLVKQEPGGHTWIYGQTVISKTVEV